MPPSSSLAGRALARAVPGDPARVGALNDERPGAFTAELASGNDRLGGLVDAQQRRRVQLHDKPRPLRVFDAAPNGTSARANTTSMITTTTRLGTESCTPPQCR